MPCNKCGEFTGGYVPLCDECSHVETEKPMKTLVKPMLAANDAFNIDKVQWPKYASLKLDGVRATVQNGVVYSRTLKPIPNKHVQFLFGRPEYEGFDGELIVGPPNASDVFRQTQGYVMRIEGEPNVAFHVFDIILSDTEPFVSRMSFLSEPEDRPEAFPLVFFIQQKYIQAAEDLEEFERYALDEGYEGVMLRDPQGFYKHGRATMRENTLIKVKRFADSEAEVLDTVEQLHNTNEAQKNELGRTKRSTAKAGMVPKNTLGGFLCRDVHTGVEFECGAGVLTHEQRKEIWEDRNSYKGRVFTYKHFPIGVKDKPRLPIFKGWRDEIDTEIKRKTA